MLTEAVAIVDGEHFGVDYTQLVPLLIEAVKAQQELMYLQQEEITSLQSRLKRLEKITFD